MVKVPLIPPSLLRGKSLAPFPQIVRLIASLFPLTYVWLSIGYFFPFVRWHIFNYPQFSHMRSPLMATSLGLHLILLFGRAVTAEVESDWMVPLLAEKERGRLISNQLDCF